MSDPQPANPGAAKPPGPMVFVVDDEPLVGTVVDLALQMNGYRTQLFKDPAAALESFCAASPKPDLLITDYNMPNMTGLDLIRECKATHAPLRTILCSGTVETASLIALEPQPDRLIPKPFSTEVVLKAAREVLAG